MYLHLFRQSEKSVFPCFKQIVEFIFDRLIPFYDAWKEFDKSLHKALASCSTNNVVFAKIHNLSGQVGLLFVGNRFPIINSGDTIALRSAYPSGSYSKYWLYCHTSYCVYTTCPGTVMTSSKWSSCSSKMKFVIRAMNKMDGQPINSGDTVSIISTTYGSSYRLRCDTSSSWKCRFVS